MVNADHRAPAATADVEYGLPSPEFGMPSVISTTARCRQVAKRSVPPGGGWLFTSVAK
jgi:hypothetical protein